MCPSLWPLSGGAREENVPRLPQRAPSPQPGVSGARLTAAMVLDRAACRVVVGCLLGSISRQPGPSPSTLGVQVALGQHCWPTSMVNERAPPLSSVKGARRLPSAGSQPTLCGNSLGSGPPSGASRLTLLHPSRSHQEACLNRLLIYSHETLFFDVKSCDSLERL